MSNFFPDKDFSNIKSFIDEYLNLLKNSFDTLDIESIENVLDQLDESISQGKTILTCGNGGSSSISEHLVCDFIKQTATLSSIEPRVHSLTNTASITAIANDISFEEIFSYQVERYGNKDDILFCISSSGNSQNIINAISVAKKIGMKTISFVGFNGGKAKEISDFTIHINSENYGICEDSHQILMHIFSQYLRLKKLKNKKNLGKIKF